MTAPADAYEEIRYEVTDGVATLTLHRPDKLNAFTARMAREMIDAFDRSDADDDVRAVIVTGEGRAFCAGADLARGGSTFDRGAGGSGGGGPVPRDGGGLVALRIFASLKPVIGAINGDAVGIGATMTLPMDVRVAAETARYGFVFARRGVVPEASSTWFLPRVVGISRAVEWVVSGRLIPAAEAHEAGLVRSLHAPAEVMGAALAIARDIAEHTAPVSVALARQMLWRMLGAAHPMEAHRLESMAMHSRGASPDAYEGVQSFLDKRPAAFPVRVGSGMPAWFPWWDEPAYEG